MDYDAAFQAELQAWLTAVYQRAEAQQRHDGRQAAERIVENHNRLSIALVILLGVSIMLLPLLGNLSVIGALVLLYVGTAVSSVFTACRIRGLERSSARIAQIERRRQAAWATCPPIGAEERARLIRLMNLSRLRGSAARRALAEELAEARQSPALAAWSALEDARVLLQEPPARPVDAYLADSAVDGGASRTR